MALDQETLNQFVETIRRYVRERLVPLEELVAEEDRIPEDVIDEMKEMGLFGISIATILQKRRQVTDRLAADSAIQFAAAAAVCLIGAAIFEEFRIDWTLKFVLALTWMVVALSLGAITLLLLLIRHGEASKTASLFFLVPGVTAVMAWAMFDETFGPLALIGLVATMAGVWLVTRKPAQSRSR